MPFDQTPAQLAQKAWDRLMNYNTEQAFALLRRGADADAMNIRMGETFLTFAVRLKSREMVDLLIECGADVNKPASNGWTPLDIACYTADADRTLFPTDKEAHKTADAIARKLKKAGGIHSRYPHGEPTPVPSAATAKPARKKEPKAPGR